MKKLYTVLAAITLSLFANAQNPIIFQPGPGLNDSTDQGGINGGKDCFSYDANPAGNYATDGIILVSPISNCNVTTATEYIQFDVSGLPLNVDSVFFGVEHYDHTSYCYSNCIADFYFARVLDPWYEQTLTYNNRPAMDTVPFYGPVTISFPNSYGLREYNITSMYNDWRSGAVPNNGFAIYSPTIGCNNASVVFYTHSSDDTAALSRPYLKIYANTSVVNAAATNPAFQFYPNPAKGLVTVNTAAEAQTITITDALGREILRKQNTGTQTQISLNGIASGVYFINVISEKGKTTQQLVVTE